MKTTRYNMDKVQQLPEYNPADYLNDKQSAANVLNELFMTEDSAPTIAYILGELSRKHGMSEVSIHSGIKRESLYHALRKDPNSKPRFDTIFKVINALGFELMVVPVNTTPVSGK
jgi:probable addiction module antidote protein